MKTAKPSSSKSLSGVRRKRFLMKFVPLVLFLAVAVGFLAATILVQRSQDTRNQASSACDQPGWG